MTKEIREEAKKKVAKEDIVEDNGTSKSVEPAGKNIELDVSKLTFDERRSLAETSINAILQRYKIGLEIKSSLAMQDYSQEVAQNLQEEDKLVDENGKPETK